MDSKLRTGLSIVALATASAAHAQSATAPEAASTTATPAPSSAPDPAVAPAPAASTEQPANAIQDIIVTATRREERLQQIPVTVTAITAETLARGGVLDARSLTQLTPGLTYTRSASLGQPVIRGVGSTGTSPGDESNVATYVDGVYQASPYATLGELVNVQRVEVLRGPQGTVFGRNATGGLINVITPDPSFTTHGNASLTYGRLRNHANDVDARGYITGPLSSTLAADISAVYRRDDGYVKDLLRGGTLGESQVFGVRGKLMFRPSSNAKIILTGDYSVQDGGSIVYRVIDQYSPGAHLPTGAPRPGFINAGPWEAATDTLPVYNYRRFSTSLRTSFNLGAATLETTGAYNYSYSEQWNDSDGTNFGISTANPRVTAKTFSQEIRLLSAGNGPFKWILGGYFFDLKTHAPTKLLSGNPPAPLAVFVDLEPFLTTRSYAGFAEGTYALTDKLFVTAGARYTKERRTFYSLFRPVPGGPQVAFLPRAPAPSPAVDSRNKLTYRGAIRYQITPKINVYGSYGTGFKSGVFNGYATRPVPLTQSPTGVNFVQPETLKAAEVGFKADFSRHVRVNLAAYHYNYHNLQVNARDPIVLTAFLLQNAPKVTVYGGELEVTVSPTPEFSISGFATYSHGRYDDFPLAQVFLPTPSGANAPVALANAAGKQLVRSPTTTFNLRPSWEHRMGSGVLETSATVFHSSRVYWDYANTLPFSQKPYTLVAADLGYRFDNGWRLSVAATNIFDEKVSQQIGISAAGAITLLERPRRVTFTAGYSF